MIFHKVFTKGACASLRSLQRLAKVVQLVESLFDANEPNLPAVLAYSRPYTIFRKVLPDIRTGLGQ